MKNTTPFLVVPNMASFFANYTCEYDQNNESIFCCTYADEFSCQSTAEGTWRFCPYCGEHLNILRLPENIPLPASPPPETITVEELEASFVQQVEAYTPPPRVQGADYMWPFMVCKSIVRGSPWDYRTKINFRSHYALLTLLAERYNKTVDELVKTNPLTLIGCPYKAKRLLGLRRYQMMSDRLAWEQKLNQTPPSQ